VLKKWHQGLKKSQKSKTSNTNKNQNVISAGLKKIREIQLTYTIQNAILHCFVHYNHDLTQ